MSDLAPIQQVPEHEVRVLIIGGGFSGLGVAIELLRRGERDFVVLEKARQLGGTWRENTYPGCACDVPSQLYSFSFAQKPDWSRVFAEQPEIQRYLLDVARDHGVLPYVRLGREALECTWDETRQRWRVQTGEGLYEAQFVVTAQGPLHELRVPELPGLESFEGTAFHSARWDHAHALEGRRVAVIGTGSSAIQFVPKIQPRAAHLTVFQRTAPWVLPKPDHTIPAIEAAAFRNVPGLAWSFRQTLYGLTELLQLAQRSTAGMSEVQRLGLWQLERQVADPELRAALTPDFVLGCKRLLLSNTYYPAIQADNATLVPHGVAEVTPTGLVDARGQTHEVDTIIFGTGFHVTDARFPWRIVGRGDQTLGERWGGTPEAYLGTTNHGFPNLFHVIGPNTGNGHGSAFTIIEAQAQYIGDAVARAREHGVASYEVRERAQRRWNQDVQAALKKTVWNAGGCASYYLDENGNNPSIYPWSTIDLRRRLRRFDAAAYAMRTTPENGRAHGLDATPIALKGALVVVTGGARGIGLACAKRFCEAGAQVVLADRDVQEAERAARAIGAVAMNLDVAERASWERLVSEVEATLGPIDVLVNNAGVMPTGRFLEEDDATAAAALRVNHGGVTLGMKVVLPTMIERARGHVVNVASLAGKLQVPFMASYVASKHAVVGLTGAVRQEIEGSGVTLSCVMPAAVRTRLSDGIPLEGLLALEPDDVAKAVVASVASRRAEISVPRLASLALPVYAALPARVRAAFSRLLGADRIVTRSDRETRARYRASFVEPPPSPLERARA